MKKQKKFRAEEFKVIKDLHTGKDLQLYTRFGKETPAPQSMPSKIVLLGRHFDVRYHTKIYFEKRASQRLNGVVMYDNRLIFIDPDNSLHQMRQTLFHEVLHVYIKNAKIEKLTNEQEEKLCDSIGWGIYDLLQNNGPLAISCKE